MEKRECFEKFREYSECFSYQIDTIDFLEGLDEDGITSKYNIKYISPLLNEIFDYALIYPNIDLYYIQGLCDDNRIELYDKAYEVARACNYYMADLFDNGCIHPSVLRYYYMSDGIAYYEIMIATLDEIREFIPEEELYSFDQLFKSLDKGIMLGNGKQVLELSNNVKKVKNPKCFMHYIARNALDLGVRRLLLFDENDSITFGLNEDDNCGSIFRNVENDKTLYLIDLFTKLEELKETDNEELIKYIEDASDDYKNYKNNQYKYLHYSYLEAKLLKKCKNY